MDDSEAWQDNGEDVEDSPDIPTSYVSNYKAFETVGVNNQSTVPTQGAQVSANAAALSVVGVSQPNIQGNGPTNIGPNIRSSTAAASGIKTALVRVNTAIQICNDAKNRQRTPVLNETLSNSVATLSKVSATLKACLEKDC